MAVPGSLSWSLGGRLGLGVLPLDHGGPCAGVYPGPWGTVTGPWGLHLGPCRTILSLGGCLALGGHPGPGSCRTAPIDHSGCTLSLPSLCGAHFVGSSGQ